MRRDWDTVFKMSILEFLNVIAYRRDKAEEDKRQIELWKKRN